MKQITKLSLLSVAVAVWLPALSHASTNDVFRARLFLRGAYQDTNEVTQALRIGRAPLNNAAVINLARGRNVTNAVPEGEILAMMRDTTDHDRKIIVFDKNTQSNLVTVADIDGEGRVRKPGQAIFIWDLDVENSGTSSNGLTSGEFKVAGERVRTNSTFLITGKLIGTVNVTSDGDSFHLIVPDGALRIRGPAIGQVVEDDN